MTTLLNFGRDVQGYNAYAPPPAEDKFSVQLIPGGNDTFTIPSNYENWVVSFSFPGGSIIWVAYNGTASPPAGATFAPTNSELLPGARHVIAGTTINMFNNGTANADIGVSVYAVAQ